MTLKDHQLRYAEEMNGNLIEVDPATALPTKKRVIIDYLDCEKDKIEGFERFTDRKNILCHRDGTGQLQRLSIPSYVP